METQKTSKGVSFYARTQSLETAQRVNAERKRYDNHRPTDEFIAPMWCDPSEIAKRRKGNKTK